MGSILHTLRVASVDLVLFMVLVLIIYFGFSAAFFVCFGHADRDFRTLADSVGALNRIVLGDYNYVSLDTINPTMAKVLFYSFVLVVVFVVLSMFLALIGDAYAEVKADEPADIEFFTSITTRLFKRAEDVQELSKQLEEANVDGDTRVSMEELEYALRDNPKALELLRTTTVGALMAKYDVDDDGVLNKEELCEILAELAEKEAEIQETIQEREREAVEMGEMGRAMTPEERARANNRTRLRAYNARLDGLGKNVKELSKNIAKKLSTMIDLMVSLSDQIARDVPSDITAPTWVR
jgi:Ca2+-binding EF-hand superfamily protein